MSDNPDLRSQIATSADPYTVPGGYVQTIQIYPGKPVRGWIVGHRTVCTLVHWRTPDEAPPKGRHLPHLLQACPYCALPQPRGPRPQGYLQVLLDDGPWGGILQIPASALAAKPYLDPDWAHDLRGLRFSARRTGRALNSPVEVIGYTTVERAPPLPAAVNMTDWLLQLWGLADASAILLCQRTVAQVDDLGDAK